MKIELTRQKVHNEFTKKVELISGQNLFACYQCGNCTAGCPATGGMPRACSVMPGKSCREGMLKSVAPFRRPKNKKLPLWLV